MSELNSRSSRLQTRPIKTWLSQPLAPSAEVWGLFSLFMISLMSTLTWKKWSSLDQILPASSSLVYEQGQWWRAWTTLFVHSDFAHLLSNSFFLMIFGTLISGFYGWRSFLLLGFFCSGLLNFLILLPMEPHIQLIGASGWVYWLGGFWLGLFFLIDLRLSLRARLLRTFGVTLALFMPTEAFDPQISYASHFWGFIFGLLVGVVFYSLNKTKFRSHDVFAPHEASDAEQNTPGTIPH